MVHATAMALNCSPSCIAAIQAANRPSERRGCQASATPFLLSHGNVVAASQRRSPAGGYSAGGRISLKNVNGGTSSRLLQREADVVRLTKSSGGGGQRGGSGKQGVGAAVVRASVTIGVVKEVREEVAGLYYNLTVSVPQPSPMLEWNLSPGRYVEMLPVKTTLKTSAAFFVSAPPRYALKMEQLSLEFLIQATGTGSSVANELIASKEGDGVIINPVDSPGFNPYPIQAAESVLMFASGYGLGPIREFIESGFGAKHKKDAILYTLYVPGQAPYKDKYQMWEKSGVTVIPFESSIKATDPATTVVLMVASVDEQQKFIKYFESRGMPSSNIQTLFDGIPTADHLYINKVHCKPNFLHMGEAHAPFALKL